MLHDQDLISIQEVRVKVQKAWTAWQRYRSFGQEQVDAIVERMAAAARTHSRRLAELAVEETGYGNAKDKLTKNLLCADLLPRALRGMKTIGLLREFPEQKIVEYAVPVGVVAAILPTTNPTSTAIYKTLISLKAGNAIVLSPHPRARRCTCETIDVLSRAAIEAGAPEDVIQCVASATIEGTNALMRHERVGVILSTGGHGIVKAAYSSGKPAFGVGPGNVPVLLEKTADVADSVAKIVDGKSFDYGTVCSSEQAIVTTEELRAPVLAELKKQNAYLCSPEQTKALAKILLTPKWTVNPDCVGQPAPKIARMAGFEVPPETRVLAVEVAGVGKAHPLSAEKLSPVLSLFFVKDFAAALDTCESILRFGGLGHTCVIYSRDDSRIREFAARMPSFRVLVNTPSPQGSTGITTNVFPAMTLGCGAVAGNITGDNIGPQHLMNTKRLAYAVRKPEEALDYTAAGAPAPAAGVPERRTVIAAVEKYLAQRGLAAPDRTTADVVDRFLAAKRASAPAAAPQTAPSSCGCAPDSAPACEAPVPAAAPEVVVVDFVCESDVRQAVAQSRRIYIGPRTIVTPAARELADRHDTLVQAQRS